MGSTELWHRFCETLIHCPSVGLSLDPSRVRVPLNWLSKKGDVWKSAMRAMELLEQGKIANPDEDRMVGHYWLRTPEKAPSKEITQSINDTMNKVRGFSSKVRSGAIKPERGGSFTHCVYVGIGGSALGPQLLVDSLSTMESPIRFLFLDNTDPDGIARVVQQLGKDIERTLTVVVSKSGSTVETRNGMLEMAAAYAQAGLSLAKHVVAITMSGSTLDHQASAEGWLERFELWDWVGGRTSLFSPVGILPAALLGIDDREFVAGAAEMDRCTMEKDLTKNPAGMLAFLWHQIGEGRGAKDMVVIPYKDRLVLMSRYLQQLVMESLGKEFDLSGEQVHQGLAVYGNKGSTDQHAYVQQLRDGLNNFFLTLIEVRKDYSETYKTPSIEVQAGITSGDYLMGFLYGTRSAIYDKGRDCITITLEEVTPRTVGALIALYERAVGFYASLIDVNAYHQPGVEAGKKAATRIIELQSRVVRELEKRKGEWGTAEELALAVDAPSEIEHVYHILMHLAANEGRKVKAECPAGPVSAKFQWT